MPTKKFSEFEGVALGQTMVVVGVSGGKNVKSASPVLLLSKENYEQLVAKTNSNADSMIEVNQTLSTLGNTVSDMGISLVETQESLLITDENVATLDQNLIQTNSQVNELVASLQETDTKVDENTQNITNVQEEVTGLGEGLTGLGESLTALDEEVVKVSGEQTVSGEKTFTEPVHCSAAQSIEPDALVRLDYLQGIIPVRQRTFVTYTGLNINLLAGVPNNLLTLLSTATPATGVPAPFLNMTSHKFNFFNDDRSFVFKITFSGTFTGGSGNRALVLDMPEIFGNTFIESRDAVTEGVDTMTFSNILSLAKNDTNITQGRNMTIKSLGGNYNITSVMIIAEQITAVPNVTVV